MGLWATWSSWRYPFSLQGGWARWPLKVLSNSKHSMILRFYDAMMLWCYDSSILWLRLQVLCWWGRHPLGSAETSKQWTSQKGQGRLGDLDSGVGNAVGSSQSYRTNIRLCRSWETQNHLSQQGERRHHLEFVELKGKPIKKADCSQQRQALCKSLYLARLKGKR